MDQINLGILPMCDFNAVFTFFSVGVEGGRGREVNRVHVKFLSKQQHSRTYFLENIADYSFHNLYRKIKHTQLFAAKSCRQERTLSTNLFSIIYNNAFLLANSAERQNFPNFRLI